MKIEHRSIPASSFQIRNSPGGTGRTLTGKIAYNSRSQYMGFFEEIAPGAFTASLRTNEVLAYWSHDTSQVLGRQSNSTLRLKDTPSALLFECDLDPNTTWGANAIASLKRGDVTSNSFGFSIDANGDDYSTLPDGNILRTVRSASLWEVSPVSVPAYDSNVASIRSSQRDAGCQCRCERCLDDDCTNCIDTDCDSEQCDNCPMQADAQRADSLRIRKLFSAMRSN
jgi:HK97 family phage prohead protease